MPRAVKAQSGTGTFSTWAVTISKMQAWRTMSGSASRTLGASCRARSRLARRLASPPQRQRLRPMNLAPVALSMRRLSSKSPRPLSRPSIGDGPRKVVFEDLARDLAVELVVAGLSGSGTGGQAAGGTRRGGQGRGKECQAAESCQRLGHGTSFPQVAGTPFCLWTLDFRLWTFFPLSIWPPHTACGRPRSSPSSPRARTRTSGPVCP